MDFGIDLMIAQGFGLDPTTTHWSNYSVLLCAIVPEAMSTADKAFDNRCISVFYNLSKLGPMNQEMC
jgi:hypothetical protein